MHPFIGVDLDAVRDLDLIDFLRNNLFGMVAKDKVDLMGSGIQKRQESLEINRTAGTAGCNHKFHGLHLYAARGPGQARIWGSSE